MGAGTISSRDPWGNWQTGEMYSATNRHINKPLNFKVSKIRTVLRLQLCLLNRAADGALRRDTWLRANQPGLQAPSSHEAHGPSHPGCLDTCGQGSWVARRLSPNCRTQLHSQLPNITGQPAAPSLHTHLGFWAAKSWTWRRWISVLLQRAVMSSWFVHIRFGYRKTFAFCVQPGVRLKMQIPKLSRLLPLLSQNFLLPQL